MEEETIFEAVEQSELGAFTGSHRALCFNADPEFIKRPRLQDFP